MPHARPKIQEVTWLSAFSYRWVRGLAQGPVPTGREVGRLTPNPTPLLRFAFRLSPLPSPVFRLSSSLLPLTEGGWAGRSQSAHFADDVEFSFCHGLDGQALPALHHFHIPEFGIVLEVFQAHIRLKRR